MGLCAAALVALLLVVAAAATAVVAVRRNQLTAARESPATPSNQPAAGPDGPRVGAHWHVPYRVYLCDRYLAPVEGDGDQGGIHSHGDGMVHVEPTRASSAGTNATFRRFEEAEGLRITATSLRWRDGTLPVMAEVSDGCGGQDAEVVTFVDGTRTAGPPGRVRLRDGQSIVIALVPKDTQLEQLGGP